MEELNNNIGELCREKYIMINKLKIIEEKIKQLEKERVLKCSHEWITERESGIYGEKYIYCKHCGVNKVW